MVEEIYAPIISTEMTIQEALRQVCKIANGNKTIAKGFGSVTKAIMRREAKVVVMADNLPDNMKNIIIDLGRQFNAPIIKIATSEELGAIVGFQKIKDSEVVKTTKCGSAAIIDYVYDGEGKYFIENALRDKIGN